MGLARRWLGRQREAALPVISTNPLQGERLADLAQRESVNFYREVFLDSANRALVEWARCGNELALLKHITQQDFAHPELYDDERFEHRVGLQRILECVQANGLALDVLDLACGNAELLKRLVELGHRVTGVDASPVRVLRNREAIRSLFFGFCERLPLTDASMDVVVATEALEHVADLERTLAEIHRVLRPHARAYAQVPDGTFADGVNHLRHFTEDTLVHVFERSGFRVEAIERVPYLEGEDPNNLFLTAIPTRVG